MDKIETFYDVLETVSDAPLLVEAEISLLPHEKGGRKTPITANYRPNHNFGNSENRVFYIGQLEIAEDEWLHPGESRILVVTFLDAKGLREKLHKGVEWLIQEGSHVVGKGLVKYVVAHT